MACFLQVSDCVKVRKGKLLQGGLWLSVWEGGGCSSVALAEALELLCLKPTASRMQLQNLLFGQHFGCSACSRP